MGKVTFLDLSSSSQPDPRGGDADGRTEPSKRQQISELRKTTILTPEFMGAVRRTKLHLGHGEHAKAELLCVDRPLHLQCREAKVAFLRQVPSLDRSEDEEAYRIACKRPIRLITTIADDGGWYCQNVIRTDGHGKSIRKERCSVANKKGAARCTYCLAPKPTNGTLRPFFANLARLATAVKKQRDESLERMYQYDSELTRSESALTDARAKLEEIRRHRAESTEPIPEHLTSMDVDLAQRGVWQRVDVHSLIPMLVSHQHRARKQLAEIRGELCVLIQALYGRAAPSVQKVVRGHLLRIRLDVIRRQVAECARFAAAVDIQRIARSHLARREAYRRRVCVRNSMAIRLQCLVRQLFARQERRRRYELYLRELHRIMAIRIQSLFRSWKAVMTAKALAEEERRRLEELARARDAAAKKISSILIQSYARRFLAKRKVAERRIELSLHDRLVRLADRLMIDGDVWSFLKSINDDYRRYESIVDGILEREDTMAATFVSKVIKLRQEEHEQAWGEYEGLQRGEVTADDTLLWPSHCGRMGRAAQTGDVSTPDKSRPSQPNRSRFQMYKSRRYHQKRQDVSNTCDEFESQPSLNPFEVCSDACSTSTPPHNSWESDRLEEMHEAGLTYNASSKFIAGILRREIPDLLDDTLKRLLYAVSIRCHVPSFMDPETTCHQEAYQLYLELSPGLEKARHEYESREAVEPIIDQLHQMGFTYIKDILPRQNLSSLLENLTLPVTKAFISTCEDILAALQDAAEMNYLSRKNASSLMCSFKLQQDSLCDNRPRAGVSSPCSSSSSRETETGLPGGLWSTSPAETLELGKDSLLAMSGSARDPIKGLPYKSRRFHPTSKEEVHVRCSSERTSHPPLQEPDVQAKGVDGATVFVEDKPAVQNDFQQELNDFQQELNGLVSTALTHLDDEHSRTIANVDEETPKGGGQSPVVTEKARTSGFVGLESFEDGLFRTAADRSRKASEIKERKRLRRKHRCWAVPYSSRVLNEFEQSHAAYRNYRRGPHLSTDPPIPDNSTINGQEAEVIPKEVMEFIQSLRGKGMVKTQS